MKWLKLASSNLVHSLGFPRPIIKLQLEECGRGTVLGKLPKILGFFDISVVAEARFTNIAEILKGNREIFVLPFPRPTPIFSSRCDFMVCTKFEVASLSHCRNITGTPYIGVIKFGAQFGFANVHRKIKFADKS